MSDVVRRLKSVDGISLLPIISVLYCSILRVLLSPSSFNSKIELIHTPFYSDQELEHMIAKAKTQHDSFFLLALGVSGLSRSDPQPGRRNQLFTDVVYDVWLSKHIHV